MKNARWTYHLIFEYNSEVLAVFKSSSFFFFFCLHFQRQFLIQKHVQESSFKWWFQTSSAGSETKRLYQDHRIHIHIKNSNLCFDFVVLKVKNFSVFLFCPNITSQHFASNLIHCAIHIFVWTTITTFNFFSVSHLCRRLQLNSFTFSVQTTQSISFSTQELLLSFRATRASLLHGFLKDKVFGLHLVRILKTHLFMSSKTDV